MDDNVYPKAFHLPIFFNESSICTICVLLMEKALKEEKNACTFLIALFRMKDYTAGREGEG